MEEITDQPIVLDALAAESELFTPADIEFAARKAAQRAFEREHFEGSAHRATDEDFLSAIDSTRPSLSKEILDSFAEDVERYARYWRSNLAARSRPRASGLARFRRVGISKAFCAALRGQNSYRLRRGRGGENPLGRDDF